MAASLSGNIDIVRQLVHEGGASLSMTDSRGSTALVYAVKGGHTSIVEFFLSCENRISQTIIEHNLEDKMESAAEKDNSDKINETIQEALIWAAKLGYMDILEILLSHGDAKSLDINKKCVLTGT